jgi:hypothetical protein
LVEHLANDARLAAPGVTDDQEMFVLSASRGMRKGIFESLVVIPMPSPATAFVNCLPFTRTGPLRRRP